METPVTSDSGAAAPVPGKAWLLLAPALALAILGAHFYRAGTLWAVGLVLALLVLMLALRRPWVPLVLQAGLGVGTLEWLWTALLLAQQRLAMGAPWQRMALILGAVALLTAASAAVFRHPCLRARYRRA